MAALVVIEGPNRGAIHTLLPDINRLGRDLDNEVTVLDERASRVHAQIVVDGAGCRLEDAGSRNGTLLNGVRCDGAPLAPGDELQIGAVTYLFVSELESSRAAPWTGQVHSTLHIDLPDPSSTRGSQPLQVGDRPTPLLGGSAAMLEVQRQVFRVAPKDATVLITGESGTGKELVARAIHRNSRRRAGPFIALNGAALRGELLESELFGHEKGAFTGALARRKGAFELARGGTLFLDEVGELPPSTQAVLLRVLEGHGFRRLGGGETIQPDVRLLAATNRDLQTAIEAGEFREDLYYRFTTVPIALPPLRDRPGDVRALAGQFLADRHREGSIAATFSEDALAALEAYAFPGNVRELKNLVERLTIFADTAQIGVNDLPPAIRGGHTEVDTGSAGEDDFPTLRDVDRQHVDRALRRSGWNKSQAARLLGIDRVTLYKRIARYGLEP